MLRAPVLFLAALALALNAAPRLRAGSPPPLPPAGAEPLYAGFLQAQEQMEAGLLELALANYGELIRRHPDEAALYNARALLYQQFPLRPGAAEAAIADARTAVRLAPQMGPYHRTLGVLLLGEDRAGNATLRAAQASLEKAVALDPLDGVSRAMLFYIHRDLREPDAAIPAARAALKLQPANLGLRLDLAQVLSGRDEPAAIREWLLLLTRGQGAAAAAAADALSRRLQSGKLDAAAELSIREAFFLDNPDDLANLRAYLDLLVKARKTAQALDVAQALKARQPDDPASGRLLLAVAWSGGRLDLALDEARGLHEKYPGETAYADALAKLQLARGDPAAALRTLSAPPYGEATLSAEQIRLKAEALAQLGRTPDALRLLAGRGEFSAVLSWINLFEEQGGRLPAADELRAAGFKPELLTLFDRDAEEAAIVAALDATAGGKDPQPAVPTVTLLLERLRRHSPASALRAARMFAARLPDEAPLQVQLAESCDAAGQPGEAIAIYESLLKKAEDNPLYANNLAWLLALRAPARIPEAVALASRALALEPENASYLDTLGWAHHLAGRDEIAAPLLEQALRNGGRLHTLLLHLAAVKRPQNGGGAEARRLLAEALQQAPDRAAREEVRLAMKNLFPPRPAAAPARNRRPAPGARP